MKTCWGRIPASISSIPQCAVHCSLTVDSMTNNSSQGVELRGSTADEPTVGYIAATAHSSKTSAHIGPDSPVATSSSSSRRALVTPTTAGSINRVAGLATTARTIVSCSAAAVPGRARVVCSSAVDSPSSVSLGLGRTQQYSLQHVDITQRQSSLSRRSCSSLRGPAASNRPSQAAGSHNSSFSLAHSTRPPSPTPLYTARSAEARAPVSRQRQRQQQQHNETADLPLRRSRSASLYDSSSLLSSATAQGQQQQRQPAMFDSLGNGNGISTSTAHVGGVGTAMSSTVSAAHTSIGSMGLLGIGSPDAATSSYLERLYQDRASSAAAAASTAGFGALLHDKSAADNGSSAGSSNSSSLLGSSAYASAAATAAAGTTSRTIQALQRLSRSLSGGSSAGSSRASSKSMSLTGAVDSSQATVISSSGTSKSTPNPAGLGPASYMLQRPTPGYSSVLLDSARQQTVSAQQVGLAAAAPAATMRVATAAAGQHGRALSVRALLDHNQTKLAERLQQIQLGSLVGTGLPLGSSNSNKKSVPVDQGAQAGTVNVMPVGTGTCVLTGGQTWAAAGAAAVSTARRQAVKPHAGGVATAGMMAATSLRERMTLQQMQASVTNTATATTTFHAAAIPAAFAGIPSPAQLQAPQPGALGSISTISSSVPSNQSSRSSDGTSDLPQQREEAGSSRMSCLASVSDSSAPASRQLSFLIGTQVQLDSPHDSGGSSSSSNNEAARAADAAAHSANISLLLSRQAAAACAAQLLSAKRSTSEASVPAIVAPAAASTASALPQPAQQLQQRLPANSKHAQQQQPDSPQQLPNPEQQQQLQSQPAATLVNIIPAVAAAAATAPVTNAVAAARQHNMQVASAAAHYADSDSDVSEMSSSLQQPCTSSDDSDSDDGMQPGVDAALVARRRLANRRAAALGSSSSISTEGHSSSCGSGRELELLCGLRSKDGSVALTIPGSSTSGNGSRYGGTPQGRIGLNNLGNTCFMNSILQCLNCCPDLVVSLLGEHSSSGGSKRGSLNGAVQWRPKATVGPAFCELLRDMWQLQQGGTSVNRHVGAVSPRRFLTAVSAADDRWGDGQQQDSQEFLHSLLEQLQSESNRITVKPEYRELCSTGSEAQQAAEAAAYARSWHDSLVDDLFGGQLQSTVTCSSCGHQSRCFDPFLDLSVPIPKLKQATLQECLSSFVEQELLTGSERVKCSKCKQTCDAAKRLQIFAYPRLLLLTLKRFNSSNKGGFSAGWLGFSPYSKNQTPVVLDAHNALDLSPYCNTVGRKAAAAAGCPAPQYELLAVSEHSGCLGGGHYTAQGKNVVDGSWSYFNDSSVTHCQPPNGSSSSAYVLFYRLLGA